MTSRPAAAHLLIFAQAKWCRIKSKRLDFLSLYYVSVTLILMADTKEELDSMTETVETIGKRNSVTIEEHYLKQRESLNTALPIGVRQVETMRTMLTQSLAVLMPFNVQELNDKKGCYYGINQVSKNINIGNRKKLINGNGFVFGVPGSGKSFFCKMDCNSFMTTYQNDRDRDSFFRDLPHRYEIIKIVRENKDTKQKEVIYQSVEAEKREMSGIEKMLIAAGIQAYEKLIKFFFRLNKKSGMYHTVDMLNDSETLFRKCADKREEPCGRFPCIEGGKRRWHISRKCGMRRRKDAVSDCFSFIPDKNGF